jgi:hypothetical protein
MGISRFPIRPGVDLRNINSASPRGPNRPGPRFDRPCSNGPELGTREQKITLGEMRASGHRRLLVYCGDYRCAHSLVIDARRWSDDARHRWWSEKCQFRTHAPQQSCRYSDHLVGPLTQIDKPSVFVVLRLIDQLKLSAGHARRSLISCACRRWATASRLTAGVAIFYSRSFNAEYPASSQPTASPQAASAASLRRSLGHRTCLSAS